MYILGGVCTRSTAKTILPRQESQFDKSTFSLTAKKQAHLRDTHKGINCCFSALATSKRISIATNCKICKEKIVLRVENKIVGGFRCLNVLQFVARLFLFDVARAEFQQLMPLWVSLK